MKDFRLTASVTVLFCYVYDYFLNFDTSYEVTSTKFTRDIFKELLVALVASVFMGFGVLFLLLWVGIYV